MRSSSLGAALIAVALLAAAPLAAQSTDFEISPFGGYRLGGEIDSHDNALFDYDVEVDDSAIWGLRLEYAVNPVFRVELSGTRQESELSAGGDRLFGNSQEVADIQIDTVELGMLFQWGRGQVKPYGVMSLGVTRLEVDVPGTDSENRLSASMGGGVKIMMERHFGLRLEGRFQFVDTGDDDYDYYDYYDDCYCGDYYDDYYGEDLYQFEGTVGLIFAF